MRINQLSREQREREGQVFAERMKSLHVTQNQIAEELEVGQSFISAWLTGRKPINVARFIWLCGRLDLDPVSIHPEIAELQSYSKVDDSIQNLIDHVSQLMAKSDESKVRRFHSMACVFFESK